MEKIDLNKRKAIKVMAGAFVFGSAVFCSSCSANSASVDNKKCMGCGACIRVCPHDAITRSNGKIKISKIKCTGCAKCVKECSFGAITI